MAKASGSIDLKTYNKASQEATNYLQFDAQSGLTIGQENLDSKVNISGDGIKLYDEAGNVGTEIKSGFVQVGQSDDGHTTIQEDGMDIYGGDGTQLLAHIGYDTGNAQSGTDVAPFYTFGTRANGSEIGNYSYAEGIRSTAKGYCSHAEGINTNANSQYSHTEGYYTTADGASSHAEGVNTNASGSWSHAEGNETTAGQASHAEGWGTSASNLCSHTEGYYTTASSNYQHVQGKYNVDDSSSTYADIVGWGTSDSSKKNIFALSTGGDGRYKGNVYVGCNNNSTGGKKVTSQAQGQVITVSGVTSQTYKDYAVTFPEAYDSTPLVVAGLAGTLTAYGVGMISVAVNNVSTTGFTARIYNASSNDRNVTFRYIAILP